MVDMSREFDIFKGLGCFLYHGGPSTFVIYPVGNGVELSIETGCWDDNPAGNVFLTGAIGAEKETSIHLGNMDFWRFVVMVKMLQPTHEQQETARSNQVDALKNWRYYEAI